MKKLLIKACLLSSLMTLGCQSQTKNTEVAENSSENTKPIERVESYLLKLEEMGFSGAVLFAKNDKILLSRGYGFSNREKQIKNSPETVFDIGSVTKQFTAAAILKLEMQGKLSVDDEIAKYFKNVPEDKKGITLHHLLTHSSGLPSGFGNDYDPITIEKFIEKSLQQKLLFKPGSAYEYSNVGYSLLGIITENLSGKSYEDYLYENLWKPAKMQQTGYTRPNFSSDKVTVGYGKNGKPLGKPNAQPWATDAPYWHLKANGGILSTASDMYKWDMALKSNDILSDEALKKYFTPYIQEGEGAQSYYSYGWAMYKTSRNTTLAAHNGGNGIYFADFWRYLDDDMVIIVLNNNATPYSQIIASQIGALYILPDFKPQFPNENDSQSNDDIDGAEVEELVNDVIKVLNEDSKEKWAQFIKTNGSKDFINMAPMEVHLNYFSKFHQKLKGGALVRLEIDMDEVIAGVKTANGMETIVINIEPNQNGQLKFGGMMVE